jgi:hypothetical protein
MKVFLNASNTYCYLYYDVVSHNCPSSMHHPNPKNAHDYTALTSSYYTPSKKKNKAQYERNASDNSMCRAGKMAVTLFQWLNEVFFLEMRVGTYG